MPPGLGLGKFRYRIGGPGRAPWVRVRSVKEPYGVAKQLKSTFIASWSAAAF